MWRIAAMVVGVSLLLAGGAGAVDRPRYDVPPGYVRCPRATAWNGFFKWASARHTTCRRTAAFMREYARAVRGPEMPLRVGGFRCRIRYWRDEQGDIYASRHSCRRGVVAVRFYGMV